MAKRKRSGIRKVELISYDPQMKLWLATYFTYVKGINGGSRRLDGYVDAPEHLKPHTRVKAKRTSPDGSCPAQFEFISAPA